MSAPRVVPAPRAGLFRSFFIFFSFGRRSDLADVKRRLDEAAPMEAVADEFFGSWVRYHRSFKEYKRIKAPKRTWRTLIYILIGPSGVGKTTLAREMFPDAYWKPNTKWWDDYDGHEAVVWDEFRGAYPFQDLLRLLDSSPLTLESKGSTVQFAAHIVVFTSNFHPRDWYNPAHIGHTWADSPLARRIREYGQIVELGPVEPRFDVSPAPGVSHSPNLHDHFQN